MALRYIKTRVVNLNMLNTSNDTISLLLKDCYDRLVEDLNLNTSGVIVTKHFGNITKDLIHTLSEEVEDLMNENNEPRMNVKKLFAILIEGLQNMYNHAAVNEGGLKACGFVLFALKDRFQVHFLNLIANDQQKELKERIDELNQTPLMELKTKYMETLTNGLLSDKGGAGLGYLTIRLKSHRPLDYQFTKSANNKLGFHLLVEIDRSA